MPRRSNKESDLSAVLDNNPVLDMDNVYLSDQGWAYRHYKGNGQYWDEILVAGEVPSGDTPVSVFGAASPTFETGDSTQSRIVEVGAISTYDTLATGTPFTTVDSTGVAVTFGAPVATGTAATGTVNVNADGDVTFVALVTGGDSYVVGETVTITEDGSTGVATIVVTDIA